MSLDDEARAGEIIQRLGDRSHGLVLIFVSALNLIPLVSVLAGPVIASIGIQMLIGTQHAWLPKRLRQMRLPYPATQQTLQKLAIYIQKIERFLKPRWPLSEAPIVDRTLGLVVCVLGLITMIPAPFSNVPPSIPLIIIGLGLAERDGLFQLIGFVMGVAATIVLGIIIGKILSLL